MYLYEITSLKEFYINHSAPKLNLVLGNMSVVYGQLQNFSTKKVAAIYDLLKQWHYDYEKTQKIGNEFHSKILCFPTIYRLPEKYLTHLT